MISADGSNEPFGNLALVKEFIKSNIIEGNQAVYIIHGSSSCDVRRWTSRGYKIQK